MQEIKLRIDWITLIAILVAFIAGAMILSQTRKSERVESVATAARALPLPSVSDPRDDFVGLWEIKEVCTDDDGHKPHADAGGYSIYRVYDGSFRISASPEFAMSDNSFQQKWDEVELTYCKNKPSCSAGSRAKLELDFACNRVAPNPSGDFLKGTVELESGETHEVFVYLLVDSPVHGRTAPVIQVKHESGSGVLHNGYLH